MKLSQNLYLRELDNALALGKYQGVRAFNEGVYQYFGINKSQLKWLLETFFPIFKTLIVFCSFSFILIRFVLKEFQLFFQKSFDYHLRDENLFLFFLPLFYNRCKSAEVFDGSKFWIVGGVVNPDNYDLQGKTLVSYKKTMKRKDYLRVLRLCFSTLWEYARMYECYYAIYKIWNYYEAYIGLLHLTKDNNIFFSNQSDRWAIMFDALPSKSKTLIQHGIASPTIVCPAQLLRIDTMYAISKQTVDDMLYSVLNCRPEIKYLKPTICLTEISSDKKTVLLVAHIMFFEQEKKILKILYDTGFDIWLKKHPEVKNDSCYKDLQIEYDYHYITDAFFPKVDCVVSYQSTLAYEYMMFNVPTFIYDQNEGVDDDKLYKFLSNVKS